MDRYEKEIRKAKSCQIELARERDQFLAELGTLANHALLLERESLESRKNAAREALSNVFICKGALRKWKKAVDKNPALAGQVPPGDIRAVAKDPTTRPIRVINL